MPLDTSDTKKIYIASAVGIVLVLLAIVQLSQKRPHKYAAGSNIAVKTSQGLIKMRADMVAARLEAIRAELQKFIDTHAAVRYSLAIQLSMENLKQMIDANPKKNLCNLEKKASIVDRALADAVTHDENAQSHAWNSIVEHDAIENMSDEAAFMYLLRNMEILISLLHNEVCEDGILDLDTLESLLYSMEDDLLANGRFEESLGVEIGNRHDPYEVKRMPLFIRDQGQLEGFDSLENYTKPARKMRPLINLAVHNKLQERSESFRSNNNTLSHNMLTDEDLLLHNSADDYTGFL